MGQTLFTGPVAAGDIPNSYSIGTTNYTTNVGLSVLRQTVTIQAAATTNVATAFLPQQSQIIGIIPNTITAWGITTAALTVGTPAISTAYLASTVIATAGQLAPQPLATAVANIATTPAVVFTVTQGAINTTGNTVVTVLYAQTTATFS